MARDTPPPPPPPPPAHSPTVTDQFCQAMANTRRTFRSVDRTLRSATKTLGSAAVLGATAYALGSSLADHCPWCKTSLKKVPDPPICPSCHKNTHLWTKEQEQKLEERQKSIHVSSKRERKKKVHELIWEIIEEGESKTGPKKAKK